MTIDDIAQDQGVHWTLVLMEFWNHVESQRQKGVVSSMEDELAKWAGRAVI